MIVTALAIVSPPEQLNRVVASAITIDSALTTITMNSGCTGNSNPKWTNGRGSSTNRCRIQSIAILSSFFLPGSLCVQGNACMKSKLRESQGIIDELNFEYSRTMNRIVFDTELDAARDNEMMKGIVAPPKLADSVRLRESGLPAILTFSGQNLKSCQDVRTLPKITPPTEPEVAFGFLKTWTGSHVGVVMHVPRHLTTL